MLNSKPGGKAVMKKDWKHFKLASDWNLWYLEGDSNTWCAEHTENCDGTVPCDTKTNECDVCKEKLPAKLITAITMYLKKDLIRV